MKAIVVEIKNNYAAVLSDDGCVTKIKNNSYEIGQVIQLQKTGMKLTRKITAMAATAAAFVVLGTGVWAYASPYTYVSVDVNPSIEFSVNRFDRVIHVKAKNEDGKKILRSISLKDLNNRTIDEALTDTVEQITKAGYFDSEEEGGIVIATSSPNEAKAADLASDLKQSVEQETEASGKTVTVESFSVAKERVEEAKKLGVTPGKLNLVRKLQEASANPNNINIEEWLNKPVKDIIKATNDYKTNTKKVDKTNGEDSVSDTLDSKKNAQDSKTDSLDSQTDNQNPQKDIEGSPAEIQDTQADNGDNNGKPGNTKLEKSKSGKEKSAISKSKSGKPAAEKSEKDKTKKEKAGKGASSQEKASIHNSNKNATAQSGTVSNNTKSKSQKENTYDKKSNGNNANSKSNKNQTGSINEDNSAYSASDAKANKNNNKSYNSSNDSNQDTTTDSNNIAYGKQGKRE